jgi:hypothetical protein
VVRIPPLQLKINAIMGKDMDRLSEDNYRQKNESYIQRLRDERDEKLKKRYEELKGIKLEKKEDK